MNTVFQQYALFPHLDVFDNVAFGPRAKGLSEAETESRVRRMLDVVRLADLGERRPDQLSGGQNQRVALARALVNSPSALLLDEPLSALDLKLRQAMQIELKRIQREVGITFIFVTHDQEEALTMSDRIAVMSEGSVEQIGTPEEIYDSPATAFVAGFIGTANLLAATVERAGTERAQVRLGSCVMEARCSTEPPAAGEATLLMVRPEDVSLATGTSPNGAALVTTLVELRFHGPVLRCVLRDESGRTILANVRPDARPSGLERGRTVYASWTADRARLLRPVSSAASGE